MKKYYESDYRLRAYSQGNIKIRNINPDDIYITPDYNIEIFASGLDAPKGIVFSDDGDLFVAESGMTSGKPKILRLFNNRFVTIAENFTLPITGISYLDGNLYISQKNYISVLRTNGNVENIIAGIPCNGDFGTSNVAFGPDGKIYFGLGAATNSGVVGADNPWVYDCPLLHDIPATNIIMNGQNFETDNILLTAKEKAYTGGFSSYGTSNQPYEIKKGILKASGSIVRANRDGTQLELVAWGFRNPVCLKFDREFRLIVINLGYDVRGSRPIANAPDELHYVQLGVWYGWPDFAAGEPVTLPRFRPEGGIQPEFLFAQHPNIPPKPFIELPPHSSAMGFDINYNSDFGPPGDIYLAEFGSLGPYSMGPSAPYAGIGHRISRLDMNSRELSTFISNKTGLPALSIMDSGFGRLVDIKFGPDGAMYLLEIGISEPNNVNEYLPNTGVIWKVTRVNRQ